MGYTKLFSTIITSTVWEESPETCKVWITLLAMANKNGVVEASVPGLARMACLPTETARDALAIFLAPDPDSRTTDHGGRRIKPLDDGGGWLLLNHTKYRQKMSEEDRRQRDRQRKREARRQS